MVEVINSICGKNLTKKAEGNPDKGSSLKVTKKPDEIQKHIPKYCKQCGEKFNDDSVLELHQRKQEVVISPIKPKFIEHQS